MANKAQEILKKKRRMIKKKEDEILVSYPEN